MADTRETIRLLRVKAVAEGLDKLAAQNTSVADSMAHVIQQGDRLALSIDKIADKSLSLSKPFEAYLRSVDPVFTALDKFSRYYERVTTQLNQKKISPQFAAEEFQRLSAMLDKVGMTKDIAINFKGQGYEQIRAQAEQVLAMRAGIAEAEETAAARRAALEGQINQLMQRALPIEAARIGHEKELKAIQDARRLGMIDEAQKQAMIADVTHRQQVVERAHAMSGGRVNRADLTNLSYQLNDIVQMGLMGANPLQILVTQGPQIFQILAGSRGGIAGGLKMVATLLAGLVSPANLAFGAILAGATASAIGVYRVTTAQKELQTALTGVGRGTQATAAGLEEMAQQGAQAGQISIASARDMAAAYARTGNIATGVLKDLIGVTQDYADTTGQSVEQATQELARIFADPAQGADELAKRLGNLDAFQIRTIALMAKAGQTGEAQRMMFESMDGSLRKHGETLTWLGRLWESLGRMATGAAEAMGRAFVPTQEDVLDAARKRSEALRQRLEAEQKTQVQNSWLSPLLSNPLANQRAPTENTTQQQLQRSMEEENRIGLQARAEAQAREVEAAQQAYRKWRNAIFDGLRGLDDTQQKIEDIEAQLKRIDERDTFGNLIKPEDIANAERLRKALEAQKEAQQRYLPFGGQQGFEAARDAAFDRMTAGLTDYERGLEEINKRWDEQIEAIRRAGGEVKNLEQGRADAIRAFQMRQTMDVARSARPDIFQAYDIQKRIETVEQGRGAMREQGFSDTQINAVIERLQENLRNLRSPMQQLLIDYGLEQRSINAITFEQKASVEADRAREEALRSQRSELEAATAAEIARANAVARSVREAFDSLREAKNAARTAGLRPFQREQAEIGIQFEERRRTAAPEALPQINEEEGIRKAISAREAMLGPLRDAYDSIREQVAMAKVQAETYGETAGAIAQATEYQRLLLEYQRAGVPVTAELKANIQAYAQQAGAAAQYEHNVRDQTKTMDDLRNTGKDALKGFISDLRSGKDAGEALLNVLNRIIDKILDMAIDSLFDPNGGGLFGLMRKNAAPTVSTAGLATLGTAGLNGTGIQPSLSTIPLSKTITSQFAGSLVPDFTGPIKQVSSEVTSNLGRMYTTVNDGVRHEVETYFRQLVVQRGGNPDILAAGINQESGFNPYAVGDHGLSRGVMQLYTGGGLGNEAMRRGISLAPENWRQQVEFGVDEMFQRGHGAWYGYRDIGIRDPWAGIPRGGRMGGGTGTNMVRGDAGLDRLSDSVDNASDSFQGLNPNLDQFGNRISNVDQIFQQQTPQLQNNLQGITGTFKAGSGELDGAFTDTAGIINKSGDSLGNAFSNAISKLSQSGGGGMGGLGNLLGGFGGGGSSFQGFSLSDVTMGSDWSFSFHEGGMVGSGGRRMRVDPRVFIDAPRLHRGNLRPDERPIIAQTGEMILSRDNVRDATRNGQRMGQGAGAPTVMQPVVNVVNPPSQPDVRTNPDGSVDIMFERFEDWQAERVARGRGTLAKATGARATGGALKG